MTASDSRSATDSPPIPRPAGHEAEAAPRGTRPRTHYWDVTTASWRSRSPLPGPRTGD